MGDSRGIIDDLRIDRGTAMADAGHRAVRAAIAVGLIAAAASGWIWWRSQAAVAAVVVEAATAPPAESHTAVERASGFVTATRRTTVSSKVTGRLDEVLVETGMRVRRGQVLARLNDTNARVQLDLALAQQDVANNAIRETEVRVALARLSYERGRRLHAAGLLPQSEADTVRSHLDGAEAALLLGRSQIAVAQRQVAVRQTDLDDLTIRAPFDGLTISKDAQPGEMVSPISGGGFTRTGICTIVDMASLAVEVNVAERAVERIHLNQRVTAVLEAYPHLALPARVVAIVPAVDRQTGTVVVRIAFERLDPRILPDMTVKATFHEGGVTKGEELWH